MAAIGRLQKPARIHVEKPLDEITTMNTISAWSISQTEINPGNRADNAWVTIDGFQPPITQDEWEHMCFLDKTYHGYFTWPKTIKYTMNQRGRYTRDNMPEHVALVYDRFNDVTFVSKLVQCMVAEQAANETNFHYVRSTVFKVTVNVSLVLKLLEHCFSF